MDRNGIFDGTAEVLQLPDQWLQDGDQRADQFALGLAFDLATRRGRRLVKAGQQVGDGAVPRVTLVCEEGGKPLFPEPLGAAGRGVAVEEGQSDGRVDLGEDLRSPGPEALEQGPELVGQRHPLDHQIVAGADHGPQGPGLIGKRLERTEAVAVGAEQVSENEGIAGITLPLGGGVTRARGFQHVGVNWHNGERSVDQTVDEEPRRALDCYREGRGRGAQAARATRPIHPPYEGSSHAKRPERAH